MADIGEMLHAQIKADFEKRCAADGYITAIKRKIEKGTADMSDMSVYSRQLGARLRQAIESNVKEGDFTDGKIYFETARSILEPLLRDNYEDINAVCAEVQRELDKKQGIGLVPQKAAFPTERVRTVCGAVSTAEDFEQAQRRMASPAENITESFYSDYVEENADFRSSAGLDTYIERTDSSGCCAWCAALVGRYSYPDDVPDDIFRRHDNCSCDVSYVSSKGRQNVHTKKWETGKAQRIEYEASVPKPMRLTVEEAKAKEAEILAERTLTYRAKRGIIKAITVDDIVAADKGGTISKDVSETIIDTIKQMQSKEHFIFDDVAVVDFPDNPDGGTDVMRTNAIDVAGNPSVVLELNSKVFMGRNKAKMDRFFKGANNTTCNSLEDAVIHECGHAKTIYGRTYANYERIDTELSGDVFTKPIRGRSDGKSLKDLAGDVSELAQKDGLECIAECGVKLARGEEIAPELKAMYDTYISGGG